MRKPTIHTNGTSAAELYARLEAASHKTMDALKALEAAYPNGRDYYVQGSDAIAEAIREHESRCAAIKGVYNEIGLLLDHVADSL